MQSFRWTKLQDFCLRIGLLKALVVTLPRQRQSQTREAVLRRFDRKFFRRPATTDGELLSEARRAFRADDDDELSGTLLDQRKGRGRLIDILLCASTSPSWGQPIVHKTSYKVVEWALGVGLLAPGFRITERSLMILALLDQDRISEAFRGDAAAWNPFDFTQEERALLFYHLGEQDEILWRLANDVGRRGAGAVIEASDAHEMTARAMKALVELRGSSVRMEDLPRLRVVKELLEVIEWEAGLRDQKPAQKIGSRKPYRPLPATSRRSKRKTTKNADHQAIPRFEQLVDLGFLTKAQPPNARGKAVHRARSAWRFEVTPQAARFAAAVADGPGLGEPTWHLSDFSRCVVAALATTGGDIGRASPAEVLELFIETYGLIRRPAGHTPVESVAVLAMVRGAAEGVRVEVEDVHDLLLSIKRQGLFESGISFGGGNELERMFVRVLPDHVDPTLLSHTDPCL